MPSDTLENILTHRRRRVADAKQNIPQGEIETLAKAAGPVRDFLSAVAKPGWISLIAEMKKKSPSAGLLRQPYDPAKIASAYEKAGAAALSVLTERDLFEGELPDIGKARSACRLPVLRKDFIIDPYEIPESRANGADAVLLIADMLDPKLLIELAELCRAYGMEPLVEIFTEEALEVALSTSAKLIGINTRNLRTLEMRPDNIIALSPQVPADRYVIAESGIKTPADVERLRSMPIFAMLVGESLLRQPNLETAARQLAEAGAPTY